MRIDLKKSLFILPNLFTLSSIFCGFYALVICTGSQDKGRFYPASLLIIFAMFFDILDGRVARLTHTESAFGVEIDSLADVISFGIAPAVVVYNWALAPLGLVGIASAFLFVSCGAIRLARFNVLSLKDSGRPSKPGRYITGLPIPGAAGMLVSLIAANHAVGGALSKAPWAIAAAVAALAVLMVSTVRFRSFKDLRRDPRTIILATLVASSSLILAVQLHVVFAMAWLLTGYLAIALFEASAAVAHRIRRRFPGQGDNDKHASPAEHG